MTTWCSDVNFSKHLKESEYKSFDKPPEVFDANVDVILHQWLTYVSKMALQYAYIAYGNVSFETKVFEDILDIWVTPPIIHEPNLVNYKFNLRDIDYKKCHRLTREYIYLLC